MVEGRGAQTRGANTCGTRADTTHDKTRPHCGSQRGPGTTFQQHGSITVGIGEEWAAEGEGRGVGEEKAKRGEEGEGFREWNVT